MTDLPRHEESLCEYLILADKNPEQTHTYDGHIISFIET